MKLSITAHGYIQVKGKRGWTLEHIEIAECVLGRRLKSGEQVHHIDEVGSHNEHTNLVICPDMGYHKLLHLRTDALRIAGDANARQCTVCKKYDSLRNLALSSRRGNGSYIHVACRKASDKYYYKLRTSK